MNVDARLNLITRTMSDPQDPVSDGWLCDRGRYNFGFVTDERRITQPLLRGEDGSFAQIAWDDAIALWAGKLKAANGRAGVIGGGRLLNEEAYLAAQLFRAAGVQHLDHRSGRQTVVHHDSFATYEQLENAKTIVTVGRPPSQLAPILDLRIRKAVSRHGAKLISIGDYAANSFVPETRATTLDEVNAALDGAATPVAIVWDGAMYDGTMPLVHPLLSAHPDALRYVIPEDPNGRGADAMGLRPTDGALATRGMLEAARDGALDVLTILGANVMLRFPDRTLAEAGIRGARFVVATDLFLTETAALADLVLPVCSAFEKSGTTTGLCGEILPVHAAVEAPDNLPADGDLLVMLADALGIALPNVDDLERAVRAAVKADGLPPDVAPNPVAPPVGDGLKLIRESAIFAGGGTLAFNDAIAHLRTAQRATVNPATARKLGIAEGAKVRISAPGSATVSNVPLLVNTRVPEGAVALVDGLGAAPLNLLGETASVTIAVET
jgi:NADH-quinone oxidoreductase subunit G